MAHMFDADQLSTILGVVVVFSPLLLLTVLGLSSLFDRHLPEHLVAKLVQAATGIGLLAAIGVLVIMLTQGTRRVPIEFGNWVEIHHYHFSLKFEFDRLSVPFVILTFILCGTIGA